MPKQPKFFAKWKLDKIFPTKQAHRLHNAWLKDAWITVQEMYDMGINGPSTRMTEMRRDGYEIDSRTVKHVNEYGHSADYKQYRMLGVWR